jgi:hypothetical protein
MTNPAHSYALSLLSLYHLLITLYAISEIIFMSLPIILSVVDF